MAVNIERIDREAEEKLELVMELAKSEKDEEKEWGIKSDVAAFGRKKIDIPERW
jgi:hypothetical protein